MKQSTVSGNFGVLYQISNLSGEQGAGNSEIGGRSITTLGPSCQFSSVSADFGVFGGQVTTFFFLVSPDTT